MLLPRCLTLRVPPLHVRVSIETTMRYTHVAAGAPEAAIAALAMRASAPTPSGRTPVEHPATPAEDPQNIAA